MFIAEEIWYLKKVKIYSYMCSLFGYDYSVDYKLVVF